MTKSIVFATGNQHKVREVNRINEGINFISLTDVGIDTDLPETGDTFEANAEEKARYVFDRESIAVIAEDSGLVVPALGGEPGVYSARYAGTGKDHEANIRKLLRRLAESENRLAYFQATICYIDPNGTAHFFTGKCHGRIHTEKRGNGGFGYDPVFIPNGYDESFGELDPSIKDEVSHRKKAFTKFFNYMMK